MKIPVTMTFEVNLPEGLTENEFYRLAFNWCREDPAGFLLARPTLEERLPKGVTVGESQHRARGVTVNNATGVVFGNNCTQHNQF